MPLQNCLEWFKPENNRSSS